MLRFLTLATLLLLSSSSLIAGPTPQRRQAPKAAKTESSLDLSAQKLSVEIGTLLAVRFVDLVKLTWDTRQEQGNHGFEIERRSGKNAAWTTVGFVPSHGIGAQGTYEFTDRSSFDAATYYRIKQISTNSSATYSGSMVVLPESYSAEFSVLPAVNAPGKLLSFTLPSDQTVKLRVMDVYGKQVGVHFQEMRLSAGHHLVPFTANDYAPGVYLLKLESDNGVLTATMVK
ncbi:MAG: T9SS type A sorting domain-containing protein [Bacteroidia bacterium]|nr:T9SS type A sorting domain-containing protein [Bacteroidia bacterium]